MDIDLSSSRRIRADVDTHCRERGQDDVAGHSRSGSSHGRSSSLLPFACCLNPQSTPLRSATTQANCDYSIGTRQTSGAHDVACTGAISLVSMSSGHAILAGRFPVEMPHSTRMASQNCRGGELYKYTPYDSMLVKRKKTLQ